MRRAIYALSLGLAACGGGGGSSDSPSGGGSSTAAASSMLVAGVPYQYYTDQGSDDGIPGKFNTPSGVAVDSSYYYVADTFNDTIRRISRATGSVETIAGAVGTPGPADGNGTAARFHWPMDLALGGNTLYISDYLNSCIRALDVSDANFPVTTVLGLCTLSGTTDGVGPGARFGNVAGLAIVGGFLYVSDYGNSTIRKVQLSSWQVTTVAGTAGATGHADGTGTAATFHDPWGLSYYADPVDGDVLFIADQLNHTIRRMKLSDDSVTTVAGSSVLGAGFADNTIGLSAQFNQPWGLANDGQYLYVADSGNKEVRQVRLSDYSVTTYFGNHALLNPVDAFGALASTSLTAATALYYDADLGLIGTTMSAVYRVK